MKTVLLAAVMGSLMFGQVGPFPTRERAGTEADPFLIYNSDTVAISFDDAYTTDGFTLVRIEYEFSPVSGGDVTHGAVDDAEGFTPVDGRFRFGIRDAVVPLDNATYRLRIRVWNNTGNASLWTQWYYAEKDWRAVPQPGGCRVMP